MVMVEFAEVPTSTGGGGEVVRMKSLNLNKANAECMRGPLVPVTFRAYVPAVGELHETVVLPEPVRLFVAGAPQSSPGGIVSARATVRSEEHTSELQSRVDLVCRLLLEKKKKKNTKHS